MQRALELYASLVNYPNEFFAQDIQSLEEYMRGLNKDQAILEQLQLFKNDIEKLNLEELQELYTPTFDLSPVCSPHVGFHLFGESYKRGSLMAKLREEFQHFGLQEGSEIPDHLSHILKYCAVIIGVEQEHEVYEELLTLILFPAVEKMVDSFAETTNPYKYLIGSLSLWLTEQCGSSVY